jgi:hypothetical protein
MAKERKSLVEHYKLIEFINPDFCTAINSFVNSSLENMILYDEDIIRVSSFVFNEFAKKDKRIVVYCTNHEKILDSLLKDNYVAVDALDDLKKEYPRIHKKLTSYFNSRPKKYFCVEMASAYAYLLIKNTQKERSEIESLEKIYSLPSRSEKNF